MEFLKSVSGDESIRVPLRLSQISLLSSLEGCQLSIFIFYSQEPRVCVFLFLLALSSSLNFPTSQPCPLSRGIARHTVLGLLFLVWEVRSQGKGPLSSQAFLPKENRSATVETAQPDWESRGWPGRGLGEGQPEYIVFLLVSQNIFLMF